MSEYTLPVTYQYNPQAVNRCWTFDPVSFSAVLEPTDGEKQQQFYENMRRFAEQCSLDLFSLM